MKRLFVLMACAAVLSGCASRKPMPAWSPPVAAAPQPALVDANGNTIERIPFRAGISTVTVENLAKQYGCKGGQGAGLMTPPGPVEVYRMICESNMVFMAKCELRQCKPMSPPPPGGYARAPEPEPAPAYVAANVGTTPVELAPGTPAAPAAAVAPAGPNTLGARQVPKLAIQWNCGQCAPNEKVVTAIVQAYQSEALAQGYTVSATETAAMSITDFRQRSPFTRVMFGIMAGKDRLGTSTTYRGQTVTASDYSANAIVGLNGLSDVVGRKTLQQLIAKSK